MKRIFLGLIATIVTVSMLFSFVGCTKETPAECFDYEIEGNHIIITGLVKTDLEKIVIPERIKGSFVTEIESEAFEDCTSLKNVTILDSVTEIAYGAFDGCTSLKNVTIPDSVKEIDDYVFEGCTSLENVTIPESVTEIGTSAFEGTGVKLPERFN